MDILGESTRSSRFATPSVDDSGKVTTAELLDGDIKVEERAIIIEEKEPSSSPIAEKKIGNFLKSVKQDTQQGGMEFNMDNFF